jgi:cellulose synthase/poly-beta-1,6-N-acetylglucosamine synthase-like glycosyltransferase
MITVGICAFNEERNIGKLLKHLIGMGLFDEIIVVASGCTDKTVEIAKGYGVKVIEQTTREGKASAVNVILKEATQPLIILQGADIIPTMFAFKYLLNPFINSKVGMIGGHPLPVDDKKKLMGRVSHLLWELHHQSALNNPKAGEVCVFRNVVKEIDKNTSVDEASIEQQIVNAGYQVVYAPKAIVLNKGCDNFRDFLKQRRRIYQGHIVLKERHYVVPTMSYKNIIRSIFRCKAYLHPRTLLITCTLELIARLQAKMASKKHKEPTIWEISNSTKELE